MGSTQSSLKQDELATSSFVPGMQNTSLFTFNELSGYDISNSKKEQFKAQLPIIFFQFQIEYKNLFKRREKEFIKMIESSNKIEKVSDIRNSIRILIIIGSSISEQISKKFEGEYKKGAEDLSTALLIRHLFHFKFGIPYDQILITSTQKSVFSLIDFDGELISTPDTIFKEVKDANIELESQIDKIIYHLLNNDDFMFKQSINLTQINDLQYKFYLDEDIGNIVKPFNYNIINKKLKSTDQSEIITFLLDHENSNGFGNLLYQFIIERLLLINCKHLYVFNDSNSSGSIIKLIKLAHNFVDIFPDIKDPKLESALFYFIANLNKVYSNDKQIRININENLSLIDSYDLEPEIKNELKLKLEEIEEEKLTKISEFINDLDDEFQSVGYVPQQFIQFSKKATIFTSSMSNQISLTLPGRKYQITTMKNPKIRIFGSIFSSIIIESFLNENAISSVDTFYESIFSQYTIYKKEFMDDIILQNYAIKTINSQLPNEYEINNFFSLESFQKTHFYSNSKDWPNFNNIIVDKNSWNVDITKVNQNEYKDVQFYIFDNTNHSSFKLLSQEQLANYDIPNDTNNHYNQETTKLQFKQFIKQYQTFFCNRAKFILNETQSDLNDINKKDIRKNIRILIIVGSSITIQKSQYFDGEYHKNSEDLDTALLIRHLFRYAFGIPINQILITSTQDSDFKSKKPTSKNEYNKKTSDFYFNILNENEFFLYQHINLAQVGNLQYKFYFDENLKYIIKLFDINSIHKELSIDDKTNLLVFFLDHGYNDTISYQSIIENLLKIECKHIFLFNDSSYSGSLIKLIRICKNFQEIFPEISSLPFETDLFHILINLGKVTQENVVSKIEEKMKSKKQNEIDYITTKLKDSTNLTKIIKYLSDINDSLKSIECIPHDFIQFSQKSTIFASSNKLSFTLPGRKYNISILDKSRIRVFGSIFSSIFIESFLNDKALLSLESFKNFVQISLKEYKKQFFEDIIYQNELIEGKTENNILPNDSIIKDFFSLESFLDIHCYSETDQWPDFNSIILDKKFWNVDISNVNLNEYKDVHFCLFKNHHPRFSYNKSKYGPVDDKYYIDKFMEDFRDAVNFLLKDQTIENEFRMDVFTQGSKELIEETCPLYVEFLRLIRKSIKSSNFEAIKLLKIPIAIFFKKNQDEYKKNAKIFAEAFEKIMPFWEEYYLE